MTNTRRIIVLSVIGFVVGFGLSMLNGCASSPTDKQVLNIQERQVVEDVRYGLEL